MLTLWLSLRQPLWSVVTMWWNNFLLAACGLLANSLVSEWKLKSPPCLSWWCWCLRSPPVLGNGSLRLSLWRTLWMSRISWLASTVLWRITLIRGFGTGDWTIFLNWSEFSASPDLSPSCGNRSLLPRGWFWHQENPLKNADVVENHLAPGPKPPLRSLLWLSPWNATRNLLQNPLDLALPARKRLLLSRAGVVWPVLQNLCWTYLTLIGWHLMSKLLFQNSLRKVLGNPLLRRIYRNPLQWKVFSSNSFSCVLALKLWMMC
jgi:hypothetical protein